MAWLFTTAQWQGPLLGRLRSWGNSMRGSRKHLYVSLLLYLIVNANYYLGHQLGSLAEYVQGGLSMWLELPHSMANLDFLLGSLGLQRQVSLRKARWKLYPLLGLALGVT